MPSFILRYIQDIQLLDKYYIVCRKRQTYILLPASLPSALFKSQDDLLFAKNCIKLDVKYLVCITWNQTAAKEAHIISATPLCLRGNTTQRGRGSYGERKKEEDGGNTASVLSSSVPCHLFSMGVSLLKFDAFFLPILQCKYAKG